MIVAIENDKMLFVHLQTTAIQKKTHKENSKYLKLSLVQDRGK